ncbi:MAG: hypothetical protein IKH18_05710 [Clostridia bacterium]|nr:hypothetical protein [Clostridia bacterium]
MKTEIVYPPVSTNDRKKARWNRIVTRALVILLIAAPIVNWRVGGPAWSAVAVWVLLALYRLVLSPEPVEKGTVSILVRALLYLIVTMVLIELLLAPGWADMAIPLATLCALIVSAVLSVIDMERQQPLAMSMLVLVVFSGSAIFLYKLLGKRITWPVWTLSALAALLFLLGLMIYRRQIFQLLKKYWHTK